MTSKLTSMTYTWCNSRRWNILMVAETLHGVITRMTQMTMPDVEGDGDDVGFGW